jgi:hypothetical protein
MKRHVGILAIALVVTAMHAPEAHAQRNGAPPPDSVLGLALGRSLFDSLLSGGNRSDSRWIAADSLTLLAMAPVARVRGLVLRAPEPNVPSCPASSDFAIAPAKAPTGYRISIWTFADSTNQLVAAIMVQCKFASRGPRSGFAQGIAWRVTHSAAGWEIVRVVDRWIT